MPPTRRCGERKREKHSAGVKANKSDGDGVEEEVENGEKKKHQERAVESGPCTTSFTPQPRG